MKVVEVNGSGRMIHIEGDPVLVEPKRLALRDVRLDPENPRIQHAVSQHPQKDSLTRDELCGLIIDQPGVSDLFKSIRDNGGLMDPIYVRPDGRVIEGNCRTACLIRLHNTNRKDKRWETVQVLVVPDITDRQVAVLQGNFHVAGKNKWRAYEKAGHVYRMNKELGMSVKDIAKAMGTQERVVTRLIESYRTMKEKVLPKMKGNGLDRWSYVEELYKNKALEEFRSKPSNVDRAVKLIVTKRLKHGADVRKLPRILKNSRATKALVTKGIDHAVSLLGQTDPTVNSQVFRKVKEMTETLRALSAVDLQRLRNESKPQQLLNNLHSALNDVAKVTGLRFQ